MKLRELFKIFTITAFIIGGSVEVVAQEVQSFKGRCLTFDPKDQKNEFHSCTMTLTETTVETDFRNDVYESKIISARLISQIASGKYAKRLLTDSGSIVSSILLRPLSLANRIISRDYQQYIISYAEEGEETVAILLVKRSQAPEFQQELRSLVGEMKIQFRDPEDNTILDIGF